MTKQRVKRPDLTIPDLVILSLLDERPRHGYDVNAELERRQVRDWAAVSRPQIYYSLDKLARLGLIRAAASQEPAEGLSRARSSVKNGRPVEIGRRSSHGWRCRGAPGRACSRRS